MPLSKSKSIGGQLVTERLITVRPWFLLLIGALAFALGCKPEAPYEYHVLHERSAGGGGAELEIVVSSSSAFGDIDSLLEYLERYEWPRGSLIILVFDSAEAQSAHRKCILAWSAWPVGAEGDPPGCRESREYGIPPYVASLHRNLRDEIDKWFTPEFGRN